MSRKILSCLSLVLLFVLAGESQAQRRFLFPNVAAARLNAQARANVASINANVAVAAARGSVFAPHNAVVFAAPRVHHSATVFAAPRYARNNVVVLAQPSYGIQYAAPVFAAPIYQAPVMYAPPVFAAPIYQAPVYQASVFQAPAISSYSSVQFSTQSAYCGF